MSRVASFHLATFPRRRALSKFITVPAERWELNDSDGCVFGKVMGTSKVGGSSGVAMDRWSIFAVWRDADARAAFRSGSPAWRRWERGATSLQSWDLTPLESRGSWGGDEPFGPLTERYEWSGPIAVLTHARVAYRKTLQFNKSVPGVDKMLEQQTGCSLFLGMGESPVGELATFSIWDGADAIKQFAYRDGAHAEVIRQSAERQWFGETLFARLGVEDVSSS